MTLNGEPIAQAKLTDEIRTGIAIETLPGLIAEYHVIAAAKQFGYRYYGDWLTLSWQEKSNLVAHYFLEKLIKNHSEAAVSREMSRKSRKRSGKRSS